jgi:hypothetical protein
MEIYSTFLTQTSIKLYHLEFEKILMLEWFIEVSFFSAEVGDLTYTGAMFSINEISSNRVDLELSGKVDSEGMRQILDEFEAKLEGKQGVRMLYRVVDFEFPTAGAMMVKLGELPKLFKLMKNIDKIAMVVDKNWMRKVADFEGMVFPGLDIKGFETDHLLAAEAWLAE